MQFPIASTVSTPSCSPLSAIDLGTGERAYARPGWPRSVRTRVWTRRRTGVHRGIKEEALEAERDDDDGMQRRRENGAQEQMACVVWDGKDGLTRENGWSHDGARAHVPTQETVGGDAAVAAAACGADMSSPAPQSAWWCAEELFRARGSCARTDQRPACLLRSFSKQAGLLGAPRVAARGYLLSRFPHEHFREQKKMARTRMQRGMMEEND
ncbi:hypothetical protein DFH11DRAFT_1552073 [Phellopilus nigrolimitatus]|nr:hypothetical protein DFH11DRAFT_1552073 [Phellopilus nigrolimitatus]